MASLRSLIAGAPKGARRSGEFRSLGRTRQWGFAALVAAVLLPAGLGCTTLGKTKTEVAQKLGFDKPQQASTMICFWQKRPQHLPDPTRDGVMVPGIVGQLFLLSPTNKPADVTGDLIVQALDETLRPAGQPPAKTEIWHIDKVALKKLATKDERFGTCYALFLPWPADWKDVTNVRMQAKYDSKTGTDLTSPDVVMILDFSTPGVAVWNDPNSPSPVPKVNGPSEMRGIPDISKALRGQQTTTTPQNGFAKANPKGPSTPTFLPPPAAAGPDGAPVLTTNPGPDGSIVTTKVWTSPPPATSAPTVIPPPVQQTNFGQAIPIQPPAYNQSQPLPPAIPIGDARPYSPYQPGPNGGLPPANPPVAPGSLQATVIPRY